MSDNAITIVGNVTRNPELKFLNNGDAVVRFSVAVNRRWRNKTTNEWEEKGSFFDVNAFSALAENAANSIGKGDRVVVTGSLEQRSWETDAGEKRSAVEIKADDVALSLKWATAKAEKTPRNASAPQYASAPAQQYAFDEEPF